MKPTRKQLNEWYKALEAERHDQSWKQPKETSVTEFTRIVYRDRPVDTRFRDDIFFNAGRYAQGARDDAAVNANKIAKNLKERAKSESNNLD